MSRDSHYCRECMGRCELVHAAYEEGKRAARSQLKDGGAEKCPHCGYDPDKWVTIGTIKSDIENETETFTRATAPTETSERCGERKCLKCGHNHFVHDCCWHVHLDKSLCGCKCVFPASTEVAGERPKIVCLCGSTRFYKEFQRANYEETMAGRIVLSVGFYMHASEDAHGERWGCTPEQKIALDALHFRKIELADEVLVIDVDRYIGESTRNEINHAESLGKQIRYRSQEIAPAAPATPVAQPHSGATAANKIVAALEQFSGETLNVKPCPNDNAPMRTFISQYVRCPVCGYQEGISS